MAGARRRRWVDVRRSATRAREIASGQAAHEDPEIDAAGADGARGAVCEIGRGARRDRSPGVRKRRTASGGASSVTSTPSSSPVVLETKRTRASVRSTMPFSGFSIANVTASTMRPSDSSRWPSHVREPIAARARVSPPRRCGSGVMPSKDAARVRRRPSARSRARGTRRPARSGRCPRRGPRSRRGRRRAPSRAHGQAVDRQLDVDALGRRHGVAAARLDARRRSPRA